jgi:hypothetical protein
LFHHEANALCPVAHVPEIDHQHQRGIASTLEVSMKNWIAKTGLAVALAAVLGTGAQARTFEMGVVSSAESLSFSQGPLSEGWFQDIYKFSVATGSTLDFNATLSNVFGRRLTGISDFWSALYATGGELVGLGGNPVTRPTGDTGFYWEQKIGCEQATLGAGTYGLVVQGNVPNVPYFAAGPTYSGAMNLSPAVPEPATVGLMVAGLAAVGWAGYRRRRQG